jgi:hypothetical protein
MGCSDLAGHGGQYNSLSELTLEIELLARVLAGDLHEELDQ